VLHLLRVEQDGAYTALVSSAPDTQHGMETLEDDDKHHLRVGMRTCLEDGSVSMASLPTSPDLQRGHRSARDTTRIVAGVTRWRKQLDCVISSIAARSVDALDAPVRQVLTSDVMCRSPITSSTQTGSICGG
jgi:hypothetical protein